MRMDFTAANKLTECGLTARANDLYYTAVVVLNPFLLFEELEELKSYNCIEEGIIFHRFLDYGMEPFIRLQDINNNHRRRRMKKKK